MGMIREPQFVLPFLAVFSSSSQAIEWGVQRASEAWGSVALRSPSFRFEETDYYHQSMGSPLTKVLVVFERLFDPAELSLRKRESNRWEDEYHARSPLPVARPLNLDPGYLTEAKLVLATTKDRDHRIYLSHGIYAECTLTYHGGTWRGDRWTYPDYLRDDYRSFLTEARRYYRKRLRECPWGGDDATV